MKRLILIAALSVSVVLAGCGQTYWYCWDDGHGSPHHLGYYVAGDHQCSDAELRAAGVK